MEDEIEFDEGVRRAKAALKIQRETEWKVAEIAARLPEEELRKFARDIGMEYKTILKWRKTFERFG
jgi:hypothetical protein